MRKTYYLLPIFLFVLTLPFILNSVITYAQSTDVDAIKDKIDSHSEEIRKLEEEIKKYTAELGKATAQAQSLQSAVNTLTTNSKKLGADLKVTENRIGSTNLTIKEIGYSISGKEKAVAVHQKALGETIKNMNQSDATSLIETVLTYPNISTFLNEMETDQQFQESVQERISELREIKKDLLQDKNETEAKKKQLEKLKTQLADQQKIIEINKQTQAKLLTETKNQEAGYKQMIAEREAKRKAFEAELRKFESELKIAIDPNSVPQAKAGILSWPTPEHIITQYFGNTTFAQQHAGVYGGNGHNGVDLKAPIGTTITAALGGTVEGTGDTDTACPHASYGKWVFIRHPNGLATLYAHLSLIKVSAGQTVQTGDIIGYSGNTGYSTGPHLHFTLYASQGVKILSRASLACGGKTYVMPIADLKAYLNPLEYL